MSCQIELHNNITGLQLWKFDVGIDWMNVIYDDIAQWRLIIHNADMMNSRGWTVNFPSHQTDQLAM